MPRLSIFAAIAAAFAAVTPGSAAEPAAASRPDNDPDRIVCVTETKIGSRLDRRRVCRTRAEWAEHRAQSRLVTDRAQQQTTSCAASLPTDPC